MAESSTHTDDVPEISYEELASIEEEFDEIDMEIMRKQYTLSLPLYTKREAAISKIPNFWALVLEQSPMEIDQFIQPSDSRIFAESLASMHVSRPELDAPTANASSPKSLKIRFEFRPNQDFTDTVLEKTFHFRRARDGWTGLVSEPVAVHWNAGKDLSEGLNEGAVKLFEARKKAGDFTNTDVPEYAALKKKVEHLNGAGTSFFTWFGWVSSRRYVSAAESDKAWEDHRKKKEAKQQNGASTDPEEENDDENEDDSAVEVHEMGEELAVSIAEDLWPGAIKYFLEAQEAEDLSEADFEVDDEDDDMDDDDAEPIDIRALVNAKGAGKKRARASDGGAAPAAKKKA